MDISDICQICKQHSDQMLMLACPHDPCINCAASAYAELIHIKEENPSIFICQICGEPTALDSSTIGSLQKLSNSFIKVPSPVKTSKSTHISQAKLQATPNRNVFFCKIHGEEQLTYYCFNCFENICPQCAIHGNHKDHEVKLIKKAINQVKSDFLNINNKIKVTQNNMNKYRDFFQKSIKQSIERNHRQKASVSHEFQKLKTLLNLQEKEILASLDRVNQQNISLMTGFVEIIKTLYKQIENNKQHIEGFLCKEQVLIFEEFKNIKSYQESELVIRDKIQAITGTVKLLNSEILQQQIKKVAEKTKGIILKIKQEKIGSKTVGTIRTINHDNKIQ